MKIILSQPELEQIVSNHLATMGIDTTDKEVDFVFLEGAEIEIGAVTHKNQTKLKRQNKTKKPQVDDAFNTPSDELETPTDTVSEEVVEDVDSLFKETETKVDNDALFNEENNNTDDDDAGMFD